MRHGGGIKHDLRKAADKLLAVACTALKQTGSGPLLVAFGYESGQIELLLLPEIASVAMNSGRAKDLVFGAIRRLAQQRSATLVAISTEAWMAKQTEAARDIPPEEYRRLAGLGDGFETLISMGLVERVEAVVVTVQDADEILVLTQPFSRRIDGTPFGFTEPDEMRGPQSQYEGRTKMFGEINEETIR